MMINVVAILAYLIIHINILIFALILGICASSQRSRSHIFIKLLSLTDPFLTIKHPPTLSGMWRAADQTFGPNMYESWVGDLSRLFKVLVCWIVMLTPLSAQYRLSVSKLCQLSSRDGYLVVTLISIDLPSSIFSQV